MKFVHHLLPAVVVAAGIQASGWVAPAAADAAAPEVAYHAPSWWITAVVKGKASALLTGNAQTDHRLKVWLIGFGHGFEARCAPAQSSGAFEAALRNETAGRSAMEVPAQKGVQDGRRFADLNGCASDAATSVRQTLAGLRGSFDTAQADPPRRAIAASLVTIVNRSRVSIYTVQISEESDPRWGQDRLGDRTLGEGQAIEIPLGAVRSCIFDVRVVYVDGRVEERRGIDLCSQPQQTFDGSAAQRSARNGPPAQISDNRGGYRF